MWPLISCGDLCLSFRYGYFHRCPSVPKWSRLAISNRIGLDALSLSSFQISVSGCQVLFVITLSTTLYSISKMTTCLVDLTEKYVGVSEALVHQFMTKSTSNPAKLKDRYCYGLAYEIVRYAAASYIMDRGIPRHDRVLAT